MLTSLFSIENVKVSIPCISYIDEFEKDEGGEEEVWYKEEETEEEAGSTTWVLVKQSTYCSSLVFYLVF